MRARSATIVAMISTCLGVTAARADWPQLPSWSDVQQGGQHVINEGGKFLDQEGRKASKAIGDAVSPLPRLGRDYTKVRLVNNTRSEIHAALKCVSFDPSGQALSNVGERDDPFASKYWFNLGPGEAAVVDLTNNINVYYYAYGGGREWSGGDSGGDVMGVVGTGSDRHNVRFKHTVIFVQQNEADIVLSERNSKPYANSVGPAGLTGTASPPKIDFRIDASGRAFADKTMLGQARRVRNNETGAVAWRFDIPNGWTLIRYDGQSNTEKHIFKHAAAYAPVKLTANGLEHHGVVHFPAASAAGASPPPNVPNGGEIYAANLGIYYEKVDYGDGTFGARLTRDAAPGTPGGSMGLEKGDTIFALDDQRFRTPQDVLAHTQATKVDIVNVRTNQPQSATVNLP